MNVHVHVCLQANNFQSLLYSGFTLLMSRVLNKKSHYHWTKQGSKKPLSGRPGQVDFPFGQVTFSPSLPQGQGPRQAVRRLEVRGGVNQAN